MASLKSDHDIIALSLINLFDVSASGPGFWHCNVKVLECDELRAEMGPLWQILNSIPEKDEVWWEESKLLVKKLIIKHSVRLSKERNSKLTLLKSQLRKLVKDDAMNPGTKSKNIENTKIAIAKIMEEKFAGSKIRSKAILLDNNERTSKYFMQRELHNSSLKFISKLQTDKGEVTSTADILHEVHDFYAKLYSHESIDQSKADDFLKDLPSLDEHSKELCEGSITKEECFRSIKKMENGKSPGCDGLPAEFYKKFFHLFADSFVGFINACFEKGKLSPSQRLGLITLLCKNPEEPEFLRNWRPISLLNVDYKIISKALTNRLSQVIGKIVNLDQTCAVPGRSIHDNVHLLRNIIDYVNEKDFDCALLTLDQAKAFDRVSHDFLFQLLDVYNFGPDFKKWIKVLYCDIYSQVMVNGFFTDAFAVERSVRQGCGISPLLYVLFVEPFAEKIRKEKLVKGLSLPGCNSEAKISQYADDTTIIITNILSGQIALKICKEFGSASGSLLNLDKCWGIWLGTWRNRTDAWFGIRWTNEIRKVCGFQVGNGDLIKANWEKVSAKFEKTVNLCSQRSLSLLGKSNLIQSILCSKLWYVGTAVELPVEFSAKLQALIFKYFYNGKPESVNRATMYLDLHNGGFKIVNIDLKISALHVKHLCNLFSTSAKWKYFAIYWLGHSLRDLCPAFASNLIPHSVNMPGFYKNSLETFRKVVDTSTDLGSLTTKKIYLSLLSKNMVVPRVVGKIPSIDFSQVWPNVQHRFVDPAYRDVAWRVAHQVLPVGVYLYEKNISKINQCFFCNNVESLVHLFVFCKTVLPFWKYLENVMLQYSGQYVKIKASTIIFNVFQKSKNEENNLVLLYSVSLGKYCIWVLRNQAKFEKDSITVTRIINMFLSNLRLRILADFQRFDKEKFINIWCKNEIFAKIVADKVKVLLKPP